MDFELHTQTQIGAGMKILLAVDSSAEAARQSRLLLKARPRSSSSAPHTVVTVKTDGLRA